MYLLLHTVLLFFLFFGENFSVFQNLPCPVVLFCLSYIVLWFAANKFDLISNLTLYIAQEKLKAWITRI